MKIYIKLFLLLFIIGIASCNSQRSAQNKLNKIRIDHPELFEESVEYKVNTDTIKIFKPEVELDSIFASNDVIYVDNDQMMIEVITMFDSIKVKGVCKADTLYYYDVDTISIIKQETINEIVRVKYVPLHYKMIAFLWLILMLRVAYIGYRVWQENKI